MSYLIRPDPAIGGAIAFDFYAIGFGFSPVHSKATQRTFTDCGSVQPYPSPPAPYSGAGSEHDYEICHVSENIQHVLCKCLSYANP